MTRASIREYTEAVQGRYLLATKKGKGKILDEFIQVTGYHRKSAIRLLHWVSKLSTGKKRGRLRQYGVAVVGVLRAAWEATDRLCSKRLHPFLPELIQVLRRQGESVMSAGVEAQLCRMSGSPRWLLIPFEKFILSLKGDRNGKGRQELQTKESMGGGR